MISASPRILCTPRRRELWSRRWPTPSVPSCKFIEEFITWGGRPRPRRTPWSGCAKRRETEADEGVGRGPGGPPYIADFCSEILTQGTNGRFKYNGRTGAPGETANSRCFIRWAWIQPGQRLRYSRQVPGRAQNESA